MAVMEHDGICVVVGCDEPSTRVAKVAKPPYVPLVPMCDKHGEEADAVWRLS